MTNTKYAKDLAPRDRIIDPDGNVATVIRIRRVDHKRGRLETNRGIAQVGLDDIFSLAD